MNESTGMARPTPYDVVFGAGGFDEARFDEVAAQAGEHSAATSAELLMLPAAGALLRELLPPGTESGTTVMAQIGTLLFAAHRFRAHGRNVYRIPSGLLREIAAGEAGGDEAIRAPAPAGYVQLPRNALWARVEADAAPEPVDGFFWSAPALDIEGAPDRLDLLYALGVRAGRPGLSLFDVALEPPANLLQWAQVSARPDGGDFANVLPGGDLQGYFALTTRAEAVKLAALCFARMARVRWNVSEEAGHRVHVPDDG